MGDQRSIKAVIFDMGGVLLRSADHGPRQELANKFGITEKELYYQVFDTPLAVQATLGEIGEAEVWRGIAGHFHLSEEESLAFQDAFWKGDILDQKLVDYIGALRPGYKTALLSNAWSGARAMLGGKYNALHVFDVIVFSAEIKLAKPDPKIYAYVIDQLKVQPSEAVFVDDFPQNIEAARAFGLHAIQFLNHDQAITDLKSLLDHS